jgi:hypothetical protein
MIVTKAKAIAAAIGTFVTLLAGTFSDDIVDMNEWGNVGVGLVTLAMTVYAVWKVPYARNNS